jgi:hypothetical protein
MSLEQDILELVRRSRSGFQAFAATVDLLGMKEDMAQRPPEARARLDDLQQGFGEALVFYPGGDAYRVCFATDSLFVVREIEPETKQADLWATFCGHIFELACFIHVMERNIGNPGLRVVIAAGPLFQLQEPESWRKLPCSQETGNWFVLTGASAALKKCIDAEACRSAGGFVGGYCWHEKPDAPGVFLGTSLKQLSPKTYQRPELYAEFYRWMVANADKQAALPK